jgi:hypothetical protein
MLLLLVPSLFAQSKPAAIAAALSVETRALGDTPSGVAIEVIFRFPPTDAPEAMIQGSISVETAVLRTFRYPIAPDERESLRVVEVFPAGSITIDARMTAESRSDWFTLRE